MEFEEVDYWEEMCRIMAWTKTNVYSTLHICWGAQAGLYYHYGIQKYMLPEKLSGIYNHRVLAPYHPLMRGLTTTTTLPTPAIPKSAGKTLKSTPSCWCSSISRRAGLHIIAAKDGRQFFVTGHAEYDRDTLAKEYFRM